MSTTALSTSNLTLADLARRSMPDGSPVIEIIESLSQRNAFLEDAVFREGNLPTGHLVTSRTGLPSGTWRRMNEGVAPVKSTTGQFTETCGMLEAWSVVDAKLVDLNGGANFRASEDNAFLAGLSNQLETAFVYSSTKTNPEKIMGLAPRFDATTNPGGKQILLGDSGASGSDQTSVWLVGWGDHSVYGIVPKGSSAGFKSEDKGKRPWLDGSSNPFDAYVTKFSWDVGLCVADWRYVVRVANVDTGNLVKDAATGTDIIDSMIQAVNQMFETKTVRPAFYVNRKIRSFLWRQARNSVTHSTLTIDEVAGKPILSLMGIPVRLSDAITNTEAAVS